MTSGVSVLLNLTSRLLGSQSQLGRNVLVVSFDAEEPPHFYTENMGSVWFVDNPTVPLDRIDLMICLDLVGHPLGPDDLRVRLEIRCSSSAPNGPASRY